MHLLYDCGASFSSYITFFAYLLINTVEVSLVINKYYDFSTTYIPNPLCDILH